MGSASAVGERDSERMPAATADGASRHGDGASRNDVHLVGRLGAGMRAVTLPSGDPVVSFHLVVARHPGSRGGHARRPREPTVDTLACAAWSARARRTVAAASPGDVLEVEGSLRRRFQRAPGGSPVSFYEVEVSAVRRLPGPR